MATQEKQAVCAARRRKETRGRAVRGVAHGASSTMKANCAKKTAVKTLSRVKKALQWGATPPVSETVPVAYAHAQPTAMVSARDLLPQWASLVNWQRKQRTQVTAWAAQVTRWTAPVMK